MDGAGMIVAERSRQVREEGWTAGHDDDHGDRELVKAAMGYASVAAGAEALGRQIWPWDMSWWKPSDEPIRNLVKAGALLAAEIDRHRRATRSDPYVVPRPSWSSAAPPLVAIGDDGRWLVGYGHLEQRVFLSLAVAHVAATEGLEAAEHFAVFPGRDIRHVWAVEHRWEPKAGDTDAPVAGIGPGDDYVTWHEVTHQTRCAFPLTILDREDPR